MTEAPPRSEVLGFGADAEERHRLQPTRDGHPPVKWQQQEHVKAVKPLPTVDELPVGNISDMVPFGDVG
eukprot:3810187-Rhodomonas_salina.1